jgi:hypothetical protein
VKYPLARIFHTPVAPIIAAVILGQNHVIEGGPQWCVDHPQQHLGLR